MTNPKNVKPFIKSLLETTGEHTGPLRLYNEFTAEKAPIGYPTLAAMIRAKRDGTIFVMDSSFVPRHEIDWCVWEAILDKALVIPTFVGRELDDWLANPFSNKVIAEAINSTRSRTGGPIIFDDEMAWDQDHMAGRLYYVTLLSYRKQRGGRLVDEFERAHGRPATSDERNRLWQIHGSARDLALLRKGHVELGKSNYFADEDAVVTAGMIAFFGGHPTVLLTRDGDVLEQFAKFTELLTTHYQAMLFADLYADRPQGFLTRPLPTGRPEPATYFEPAETFLVRKHVEDPDDFVSAILPKDYAPARATCLLFGGIPPDLTMTIVTFVGETGLDRLIGVKGATGGLSTEKLGGKNCHVTGLPLGIDEPRMWAVVGKDKGLAGQNTRAMSYAALDLAHVEQHRAIHKRMTESAGGPRTA